MRAYLMCAPRDEFNLQQSQPSADSQRFIFCHNIFLLRARVCPEYAHAPVGRPFADSRAVLLPQARGVQR